MKSLTPQQSENFFIMVFLFENWHLFALGVALLLVIVGLAKHKTLRKLLRGYTLEEIRRDQQTVIQLRKQFEQYKAGKVA